jgi:two-component system, NtrC family, nitrogen regulation sensor histidine kinase NtrY
LAKLKLFRNKNYYLFASALILFVSSLLLDLNSKALFYEPAVKKNIRQIQDDLNRKEKIITDILDDFSNKSLSEIQNNLPVYLQLSNENHIIFYIFRNGRMILWTNNKVIPEPESYIRDETQLKRLANGYYIQIERTHNNHHYLGLILVQSAYNLQNKYIKNRFYLGNNPSSIRLDINKINKKHSIYSKNGKALFSIGISPQIINKTPIYFCYILSFVLLICFIIIQTYLFLLKSYYFKAILVFFSAVLLFITMIIYKFPSMLFHSELFNPEIYAGSHFFSSLGTLFLFMLMLFLLIHLFSKYLLVPVRIAKKYILIFLALIFLTSIFLCYVVSSLLGSLVIDSSIPLDINNFFQFDVFSLIGYLIIFLLLSMYIKIIICLSKSIQIRTISFRVFILIIGITGIIYTIIAVYLNRFDIIHVAFPLFLWILVFFYTKAGKQDFNYILSFIIVSSMFVSRELLISNEIKESEYRKHLIGNLASDHDAVGEQLLNYTLNKIQADNYVKIYFQNPLISKSLLRNRLKRIYFSGYFSKYDFEIHTYTSNFVPLKNKSHIPFSTFSWYMNNGIRVNEKYSIFFINNYDGAPGYIIWLPIKKHDFILGHLIIELKHKPFFKESVYPELLIERNSVEEEALKNYSFAIYKDGKLSNQNGAYSYPLTLDIFNINQSPYLFVNEKNHNHLIYSLSDRIHIIMTKERVGIFTSLSLFSILFILTVLLIAIASYFQKIIHYFNLQAQSRGSFLKHVNPIYYLSYKSKIQFSILASVFFTFLILGYGSIRHIEIQTHKRSVEKLRSEIRSAAELFDSYCKEYPEVLNNVSHESFYAKAKEIATLLKSDINLYDTEGNLITSSQMPVFERRIISLKMDAEAFYKLRILQKSQLVQFEKIGGIITYQSAYAPLRGKDNSIFAFVNLPHFAGEKIIKEEISSLIVTTVNIYLFLFLLIIIISFAIANTFTKALETIRKHLSDIQVGQLNKKIQWEGTDEIGRLITEYNEMLDKVEESTELLARSERETAWREMAKQVAHEIKNPLTPMKLNLQQLIRAWDDNSPDLEERFRKITHILIDRIENLSQIATEFSAFARMPEGQNKVFELEQVLEDVYDLFSGVKQAHIELKLKSRNTLILGDKNQMTRAFNNLLKNSLQAIPPERFGTIVLSTELRDNNILIQFSDNGIGIPENLKNKIFLPNFSTKSSGMGLGLAIVSRIIENARGKIWYKTKENEGTSFFVLLPVFNDKADKTQ